MLRALGADESHFLSISQGYSFMIKSNIFKPIFLDLFKLFALDGCQLLINDCG